ncbi:glutathione S-transferase 3-like [Dreissena polymorpha]|uniref:Uncharacterized protein n=1 Tax=Dreissena polymorpha TaxID=45954 RepID=A0A9D4H596_DREPO|nr:glutathione S-transferase 3-like [Dreissena polymorpha]KAH3828790.1 hypothetical protein DPMN_130773 [Dreissena polymorpha]
MDMRYLLTYFNKRGGGEIVRLTFVAGGQEFTDERLTSEQWKDRKSEMPMKNLPVLHVNNGETEVTYCQSGEIARYLARKFGLYGDSEEESLLVDEVYDTVGDVRKVFVQIHLCADDNTKRELATNLVSDVLPTFYSYFERRKREYGENGFIVSGKLTLADLAVFNMVDSIIEMGQQSLWQPYPELLKHHENVKKNTRIAEWLQKRPKTEV